MKLSRLLCVKNNEKNKSILNKIIKKKSLDKFSINFKKIKFAFVLGSSVFEKTTF